MRTNIEIDDALMAEAVAELVAKTKRGAVERGLRVAIQLRRQEALLEVRGIGWEGDLDAMRTNKPRPGWE